MAIVKTSTKMKVSLLLLVALISVASIIFFVSKTNENDINTFMEISDYMSKNLKQLRDTPGITLTGLAADSHEKLIKIGINTNMNKMTPEQLKGIIELYLVNTASFNSNQDWKSLFKPYKIRFEKLSNGKLIAEKPLDSTEIIWFPLLAE